LPYVETSWEPKPQGFISKLSQLVRKRVS
jgi:hypothetical protein